MRRELCAPTAFRLSKAASDTSLWEPLTYTLRWDEGKSEYELPLKEIKTRSVELLRVKPTHGDQLWQFTAEKVNTIGMKDTDETGQGGPHQAHGPSQGRLD